MIKILQTSQQRFVKTHHHFQIFTLFGLFSQNIVVLCFSVQSEVSNFLLIN